MELIHPFLYNVRRSARLFSCAAVFLDSAQCFGNIENIQFMEAAHASGQLFPFEA